jgi:hypothetical protein
MGLRYASFKYDENKRKIYGRIIDLETQICITEQLLHFKA